MEDKIQQGDQFAIPFILKFGGRLVVPQSYMSEKQEYYHATEVKIALGTVVKSSSQETDLRFDGNKWLFFITRTESAQMNGVTPWQFCVIQGTNKYYSSVYSLNVLSSLPELTEEVANILST